MLWDGPPCFRPAAPRRPRQRLSEGSQERQRPSRALWPGRHADGGGPGGVARKGVCHSSENTLRVRRRGHVPRNPRGLSFLPARSRLAVRGASSEAGKKRYSLVSMNPRIHTDRAVARTCVLSSPRRLGRNVEAPGVDSVHAWGPRLKAVPYHVAKNGDTAQESVRPSEQPLR